MISQDLKYPECCSAAAVKPGAIDSSPRGPTHSNVRYVLKRV